MSKARSVSLGLILAATLALPGQGLAQAAPQATAPHAPAAVMHGHAHADFQSERIHVRLDGPEGAPDLILIPGLSSSPRIWQGTVEHLGERFRIHRIHVQGFAGAAPKGNAEGPVATPVAEEIARYIREQNLQQPAVIGHSMGGTMGMMLAARHPDLVSRLLVVDMVPFVGAMFGPPGTTAESIIPVADQIHARQSAYSQQEYQAAATEVINGMIQTEAARPGPLNDTLKTDSKVAANAYRELIVTDLRPELPQITAPVQVLYVKFNDPRMTDAITDMIYAASFATLPTARLKRIDDSAHFIMLDQPEAFHVEVDAFLSAK